MRLKIVVLAIGVAFTSAALMGGSPAVARSPAKTKVTMNWDSIQASFQGEVLSTANCAGGRKVVLFKQSGSTQQPQSDQKVGSTRSQSDGYWYVAPGSTGRFYARAPAKRGCRAGHTKTKRAF